jgi:glutaredoxin
MEFTEPMQTGFTIYSKSGCHNCSKIKKMLTDKNIFFIEVNCDEYLIEEKVNFLSFIEKKIGNPYSAFPYSTFPMVFYDAKFIGGFIETSEYINKLLLSFEELF